MADLVKELSSSTSLSTGDAEAIRHLEEDIAGGKHWYLALLEAMGRWSSAEEDHNGRVYRYLIAGEAFDWMLLAERLCEAVDSLLPGDEKKALLFQGKPPLELDMPQLKKLIGNSKYHQYLNYFYGVIVEKALIMTVQEEVNKERWLSGYGKEPDDTDEAYRRIYGETKDALIKRFRREKRYPQLKSATLTELKEFTYWLFKYRLQECDKERVASDTRKALEHLKRRWAGKGFFGVLAAEGLITEHL
jgi:hypothetical protein